MNNLKNFPDVLTPEELRLFLHIGKNKVYELLKNKDILSVRIGQQYHIPKKFIYQLLVCFKTALILDLSDFSWYDITVSGIACLSI